MSELISALIGALVASVGGFIAVRDVAERQTRKTLAATLGAEYMARYSAPEFVLLRDEVDLCLATAKRLSAAARHEHYSRICRRDNAESIKAFNRLHALSMLFAEIGVGFQRGLIDAQGLAIFDRILPYYWRELSPFIAAAHVEFGFPVDLDRPLERQRLTLFSKFAYAYNEMVGRGIAREIGSESVRRE
jgi:hypothetical protein